MRFKWWVTITASLREPLPGFLDFHEKVDNHSIDSTSVLEIKIVAFYSQK